MFTNRYCNLQMEKYKKCIKEDKHKGGTEKKCKEEHKQLLMCMSSFAFRRDLFENNQPNHPFYIRNVPLQKNNR